MISDLAQNLRNDLSLFNEEYFGGNPLLDQCDKQIEIIEGNVKRNYSYLPNGTQENEKLQSILAELFNCKYVQIIWKRALVSNACTYPVSFLFSSETFDMAPKPDKGKYGPKFSDKMEARLLIYVYVDLFDVGGMTPREVMGIILHEVGHNFQHYTSYNAYLGRAIGVVRQTLTILFPQAWIAIFPFLRDFQKSIFDIIYSNKLMRNMMNNISVALGTLTGISIHFRQILAMYPPVYVAIMTQSAMQILKNYLHPMSNNFLGMGYRNEKFADLFATKFGYGAEVVSAERKLHENNVFKKLEPTGSLATVVELYMLPLVIVRSLGDPHPMTGARIVDQINYLEYQLKYDKELSPVIKKQIQQSLDESKTTLDEMMMVSSKGTDDEKNGIKRLKAGIFSAMLKSTNGDARELIFGSKTYKEYDIIGE